MESASQLRGLDGHVEFGFRVEEELKGIGSTTAVGRTPEVTGTLVIADTTVSEVTIEADMTAITTTRVAATTRSRAPWELTSSPLRRSCCSPTRSSWAPPSNPANP